MNAAQKKEHLEKFLDVQLTFLVSHCSTQEDVVMGLKTPQFIVITRPSFPTEFTCLGRKFIIEKDIYPFNGVAYLRTYEVILDHSNYPNTCLNHIQEMDVVVGLETETTFRFVYSSKISVTIQSLHISKFGLQYLRHLYYQLEARENKILNPN